MNATRAKRGFSGIDLQITVLLIGILIVLLVPAIQAAREAARRAECLNHSKQIGLAIQNFVSTYNNALPPSAALRESEDGKKGTVEGWSFLVKVLPFLEQDELYKTLTKKDGPEDAPDDASSRAMKTTIPEFVCPAGPRGQNYAAPTGKPVDAITNYKATGATTRDSLAMVLHPTAKPPYGPTEDEPHATRYWKHPDGAIYPCKFNMPLASLIDGTSHTILTMETIDEAASRWTVGKEATLVGLPQKSSATGEEPRKPYPFFAPPGFDNNFGDDSGVAKAKLRTFLGYDFGPKGADRGKYEDPGFSKTAPAYGPSSGHPGIAVCGMGDGAVIALSKKIDAANLFFLITKGGNDPFNLP